MYDKSLHKDEVALFDLNVLMMGAILFEVISSISEPHRQKAPSLSRSETLVEYGWKSAETALGRINPTRRCGYLTIFAIGWARTRPGLVFAYMLLMATIIYVPLGKDLWTPYPSKEHSGRGTLEVVYSVHTFPIKFDLSSFYCPPSQATKFWVFMQLQGYRSNPLAFANFSWTMRGCDGTSTLFQFGVPQSAFFGAF